MKNKYSIPKKMQEKTEPIIKEIEKFCDENLNDNFKDKAIELTCKLSRKRPSPLQSGRTKTWVAAILNTITEINFVYDSDNPIYMMKKDFCKKIGVSQNTVNKRTNEIMDMLNIDIFSREWFVEGNEFTMESVLDHIEMLNDMLEYEEDDESDKMRVLEIIYSEDLNLLDEDELETFARGCISIIILILDEVREEFKEDNYYYRRFKQMEMVINKAYDAAVKVCEIEDKKVKLYYDVLYMTGQICMEAHDFDGALQVYEEIDRDFANYDESVKLNIFNIKYYTQNGAKAYLDLQKNEKGAAWDYNKALYHYSMHNEALALKHLKKAVRKNKYIKGLLLNDYELDLDKNLSPIEQEAVQYWANCEWIWKITDGALEWMFYNA